LFLSLLFTFFHFNLRKSVKSPNRKINKHGDENNRNYSVSFCCFDDSLIFQEINHVVDLSQFHLR